MNEFLNDAYPYAVGYFQGRKNGFFENDTYEDMTDKHQNLFKLGFDAGVSDYCNLDEEIKDADNES
jgi:hypothetical protein